MEYDDTDPDFDYEGYQEQAEFQADMLKEDIALGVRDNKHYIGWELRIERTD